MKNFSDIVTSLIGKIRDISPNVDTKIGTVIRDIFIDPQSYELEGLWDEAKIASDAQSINTATGKYLDALVSNWGTRRKSATHAVGTARFFVYEETNADISIPAGTYLSTRIDSSGRNIEFTTSEEGIILTGETEVEVPIVCTMSGSIGNIASNSIINTDTSFVNGVINDLLTTGGSDVETDASLASRAPFSLSGSSNGTSNGYIEEVLKVDYIKGAKVIEPDSTMSRGPGKVDIYIQHTTNYTGTTTTQNIEAGSEVVYLGRPAIVLNNQPVSAVLNITSTYTDDQGEHTITYPSSAYRLEKDKTYNFQSSQAQDRVVWISSAPIRDYVISYAYNKTIKDGQDSIENKRDITSDVLCKAASGVPIYIKATVSLYEMYTESYVLSNIITKISDYFSTRQINQSVNQSDIDHIIRMIKGVARVDLPFTIFNRDTNLGEQSNIDIRELEYAYLAPLQPDIIVSDTRIEYKGPILPVGSDTGLID